MKKYDINSHHDYTEESLICLLLHNRPNKWRTFHSFHFCWISSFRVFLRSCEVNGTWGYVGALEHIWLPWSQALWRNTTQLRCKMGESNVCWCWRENHHLGLKRILHRTGNHKWLFYQQFRLKRFTLDYQLKTGLMLRKISKHLPALNKLTNKDRRNKNIRVVIRWHLF